MTASQIQDLAIRVQIKNDLNEALKELKPIERSIVYLHMVEGLSHQEIADAVGLTEAAVKVRVHRIYRQLQTLLSGTVGVLMLLIQRMK